MKKPIPENKLLIGCAQHNELSAQTQCLAKGLLSAVDTSGDKRLVGLGVGETKLSAVPIRSATGMHRRLW